MPSPKNPTYQARVHDGSVIICVDHQILKLGLIDYLIAVLLQNGWIIFTLDDVLSAKTQPWQ